MIVKKNTNPLPAESFARAGHEAERDVAYRLYMAFGESKDLLILNDLRVEFGDGITAQMDHLVIHQHGMIIIESKSVAGKLQVKEDGQWVRWYGKESRGMDDPIKQAKHQGQTLKRVLLNSAKDEITRKAIEAFPTDLLVTYSTKNGGQFISPKNGRVYTEVCPSHAVDDRVNEIVASRAKTAKVQDFSLSEMNRTKLAEHLVKIHKPYSKPAITESIAKQNVGFIQEKPYSSPEVVKSLKVEQKVSEYAPTAKPKPTSFLGAIADVISGALSTEGIQFKHKCRKCKSENLEVRFGKNYYLKCLGCDENNRIDATCSKCKSLLKIRKDKNKFFAECKKCSTSELFHNNG